MAKDNSSSLLNKLPFKFPFLKTNGKTDGKVYQNRKYNPCLKMVCFIVDWNKSNVITKVCEEEKVRFHFIFKGRGTASSEILDILGIGTGEKAVIIIMEQKVLIPVLFKEAKKKLGFYSPGAGIAFTIPLSGINTPMLRVFKESIHKNEKIAIKQGENMAAGNSEETALAINNDLIIAIINHGYSDDFMTSAKEAGASGGTVINARGLVHQGPVKFFGISVQEEREIVLVLTSREKKLPIMEAVSLNFGITSKAEGIIFSLPVDSVMGLNLE